MKTSNRARQLTDLTRVALLRRCCAFRASLGYLNFLSFLRLGAALTLVLFLTLAVAAQTTATPPPETLTVKPVISFTNYGLYQSNPFFSDDHRAWLESSLRLGGKFEYKSLTIEGVALALRTTGRDPFGSGSAPAAAAPDTAARGKRPQVNLDTLYVQWQQKDGHHFKATIGRQPLRLGSQFVVGDGAYDGFHEDYQQAVYHNPRRNFDAARLEFDAASLHVDSFIYRVHPTWDGGGKYNGWFGGTEVSRSFDKSRYAAGVFYRNSHSNLDNDMWVVTLRGEQPLSENLYASGEWVGEFGRGNNPTYVTTPGQRLREQAWHLELGGQSKSLPRKPFAEVGYVYYSKDFTPVATGFSDWGKWYLGNQIDWIIFSTNTRIIRAQAGLWLRETIKARAQFHHTRLVNGARGGLANEVSLIGEWTPDDQWWVNLLLGHSTPGKALADSGLSNPFAFVNGGAVALGKRRSIDVVLALGFNF